MSTDEKNTEPNKNEMVEKEILDEDKESFFEMLIQIIITMYHTNTLEKVKSENTTMTEVDTIQEKDQEVKANKDIPENNEETIEVTLSDKFVTNADIPSTNAKIDKEPNNNTNGSEILSDKGENISQNKHIDEPESRKETVGEKGKTETEPREDAPKAYSKEGNDTPGDNTEDKEDTKKKSKKKPSRTSKTTKGYNRRRKRRRNCNQKGDQGTSTKTWHWQEKGTARKLYHLKVWISKVLGLAGMLIVCMGVYSTQDQLVKKVV
jgi:hypothetical protein